MRELLIVVGKVIVYRQGHRGVFNDFGEPSICSRTKNYTLFQESDTGIKSSVRLNPVSGELCSSSTNTVWWTIVFIIFIRVFYDSTAHLIRKPHNTI